MATARGSQFQVVVVDDVVRFALHVWSYLGRSIGFGIGKLEAGETEFFYENKQPKALLTPDKRGAVWWVPANERWQGPLKLIRNRLEDKPTLFLVDVKGSDRAYKAGEVVGRVARNGWPTKKEVWVVSSYAERVPGMRVRPKSPETLEQVSRWVDELDPQSEPVLLGQDGTLHVLVTGAGFELQTRNRQGGRSIHEWDMGFGLPYTGDLLASMGSPFGQPRLRFAQEKELGDFPLLIDGSFHPDYPRHDVIADLATHRDLDEWWNFLLETELMRRLENVKPMRRKRAKRRARDWELRLREAFRNVLLRYDWGHMRQSLEAARLPWCAWLTTNYTRFADRAIALIAQSRARNEVWSQSAPRWRTVASASEARRLSHELQDADEKDVESLGSRLFKLHGDIAHLQAMAIAGHDKDLFSLLSVPIDTLRQVYNAAEKFLVRSLYSRPEAEMRFHIVGHGLKDVVLVGTLARVFQARGKHPMSFHVVAPNPRPASEILQGALEQISPREDGAPSIEAVADTAESYMARFAGPPTPRS